MPNRRCGSCKHFEPANGHDRGWCRNTLLFAASQSHPVYADDLWCQRKDGESYWERSIQPAESSEESVESRESDPVATTEPEIRPGLALSKYRGATAIKLVEHSRLPSFADRGATSPQDRSPFTAQEPAVSYQAEERYWTDYLRIALPIAGLLLLLAVFWYWASSFIGDDGETPPPTTQAIVQTTPITAPEPTPTEGQAIVITPLAPDPTQAAAAQPEPTQAAALPTPTEGVEPTEAPLTSFQVDQIVVINDDEVNMRAEPSTASDIVDVMALGTELRILDAASIEADGYTWWFVEDTLNGIQGYVAEDFIEA